MPDVGEGNANALAAWMGPSRTAFTAPTWRHVLVLVVGARLVPGRRTVASVLRVMGLEQAAHFTNYHRVLTRLNDAGGTDQKVRGIYSDPVRSSHGHFVKGQRPALALADAPA
jgi:hypothetical protein